MPSVNKVGTSVLKQPLTKLSFSGHGVKLLCYGRSGTGKTRLACTFPKPILIIGTEDGTKSVATGRRRKELPGSKLEVYELLLVGKVTGMDFLKLRTSSDLDEVTTWLQQGKYATAVIDQGGGLQMLIYKEVLGLDEVPVTKNWGMADRSIWGVVNNQFAERLSKILDCSDKLGMNSVIIAHDRNFKEEEGPSDIMLPHVGAALTPGSVGWLNGAVDYICQTVIRSETVTEMIPVSGGEPMPIEKRTGKKEFCLRVGVHDIFQTKFRHVGDFLPDFITSPTFEKLLALIEGHHK